MLFYSFFGEEKIAFTEVSTAEPKKQNKTKQKTKETTRTGTESQKWRSHGVSSVGRERERMGAGKVQGIRSTIGRYKIGGGSEQEMEKLKN